MMLELVIDSFAGGGGASTGIEGETEPQSITELLEFCRIIEDKAKEPAQ